ncbi:MAG: CDP-alcohol phosphatidyltransferase family protein [Pseudomonadaceae bacterium]|nr:CDP-alcohol phosphatidyltransferase family protein [Pseudomonadaceae bacterium]
MLRWLTWANLLTGLRLASLPVIIYALISDLWMFAAVLFTMAVVTDVYDGKIARKLNQTSPLGGLFDHGTDALFVSLCCGALSSLGLINPYLPWLIGLAFIQYMLDSKALAGVALRMSFIGRNNGIAYYVLVGVVIGAQVFNWTGLLTAAGYFAWLLVFTTVLSMADRGYSLFRQR